MPTIDLGEFLERLQRSALLTRDDLDPDAKIPGFKFCAVRVERIPSETQTEGAV